MNLDTSLKALKQTQQSLEQKLVSKLKRELHSDDNILIPGCGNSTLPVIMYDAGFTHITSTDVSRVVVSDMLRQHIRLRPSMRWLVMDSTRMKLADDQFDVVLDKGGLDAILGEPEYGASSGESFLSEVKRVLKPSGRFVCIALAQQHVIELLLSTFRESWLLNVHGWQISSTDTPSCLPLFIVIAKHESRPTLPLVSFDVDLGWCGPSNESQMQAITEALDSENAFRNSGLSESRVTRGPDINSKDCYENLHPGRRLTRNLHGKESHYTAVILDAKENFKLEYQCAVFLVPKGTKHEWLYSSIEGQWQVAESSKAGRLIMVTLDTNQYIDNILDRKDELNLLVKCLLPRDCRESENVPYMTQGDSVASRIILDEVNSPRTGAMLVEDVILSDDKTSSRKPAAKHEHFRRLIFRRNPNLIQSEAGLTKEKRATRSEENRQNIGQTSRKHCGGRKRNAAKEVFSIVKPEEIEVLKLDHSYLASPYHKGMIAAFVLIAKNLEQWLASKQQIRLMLVGLGGGLLPMFIHKHFPIDDIQIVELDPVVGDLAKRHFGFIEDDRMKLCIGDGVLAVQAIAAAGLSRTQYQNMEGDSNVPLQDAVGEGPIQQKGSLDLPMEFVKQLNRLDVRDGSYRIGSNAVECTDSRLHVLIIDSDSEDPRTKLSSPEFLQDSFMLAARVALSDDGIMMINVVSRATTHHMQCVTKLKKLFEEVYDIELSDVNRVLIGLPQPRNGCEPFGIILDLVKLEEIVTQFASWGKGPGLKGILKGLKRLK